MLTNKSNGIILEKIQAIPFVERETEKGKNIMNTLVIVLIAAVWLLGAYFECAECKKQFTYAEGLPFKDDGCPCGKA